MSRKTMIWLGVAVGSTIGNFVPALWGAGSFSFSSIICSTIGGLLGIWAAVKLTY